VAVATTTKRAVVIDGRRLNLSNLEKVLYPETGFTKAEVADYYRRVAPALLPHLRDRPLTLKRFPEGVGREHFFEKDCPSYRPDWLTTIDVPSRTRGTIRFCAVSDLASLMWLANLANLELHPLLAAAPGLEFPTQVVFDLDPGTGVHWAGVARIALVVRDVLDRLDLTAFVKSSGSKGLHLSVPLDGTVDFVASGSFARTLADWLAEHLPDQVTANMAKAERAGRVLIDWSQNSRHKSTVAAYSLRATPVPTVAAPGTWTEVAAVADGGPASTVLLRPDQVVDRLDRHGDLHRPLTSGSGHGAAALERAASVLT
jgi:bifunctional non-homologous end joining protein LigD